MSIESTWRAVFARLTPDVPVALDTAPPVEPGIVPPAAHPPSAKLFAQETEGQSYLGVRVTEPPEDLPRRAAELAAAALERRVVPIILSHIPQSGFERFGFRVERIAAQDEEARLAMEAELQRFWDLAIVVDLADIARMG